MKFVPDSERVDGFAYRCSAYCVMMRKRAAAVHCMYSTDGAAPKGLVLIGLADGRVEVWASVGTPPVEGLRPAELGDMSVPWKYSVIESNEVKWLSRTSKRDC